MSDAISPTFSSWRDRLTYLVANAQFLVAGLLISLGVLVLYFQPSLPGVPGWIYATIAALLLIGPIVLGFFLQLLGWLRTRNWETVYHINGLTDEREKYKVAPEVWSEKVVEGPSPYRCNDEDAFEVREFEYHDEVDELVVRGCYMSQLADSKLVTAKSMLEDVHGDLLDAYIDLNQLRGRISKMGVEIQADVVNEEAEADERGLMNPRSSVKERFEAAKQDAESKEDLEIQDIEGHVESYADEHGIETTGGLPQTEQQAATDGGQTDG